MKTVKTAGTSIESYFEKYCMPEGEWKESHARNEYVSETGIIGLRGPNARYSGSTWYNHMPAAEIRDLLGQEIWDRYYKFTVIRNPFNKLISGFYMFENRKERYTLGHKISVAIARSLNRGKPIDRARGHTDIERFRDWLRMKAEDDLTDRDKYLIDGEECVDYFIRFEELHQGIKHVCERLSIPFEPERIPHLKKGAQGNIQSIRDYYDDETVQIVRELYAWELSRFGYELPY